MEATCPYAAQIGWDTERGSELEEAMMPLSLRSAALSSLELGHRESLPRPSQCALVRQSLFAIRQSSNHPGDIDSDTFTNSVATPVVAVMFVLRIVATNVVCTHFQGNIRPRALHCLHRHVIQSIE